MDSFQTPDEIQVWMQDCISKETQQQSTIANGKTNTALPPLPTRLPPREVSSLIRQLAQRQAYSSIPPLVRHIAHPSAHVYTSAMSALGRSGQNHHRRAAVELFEQGFLSSTGDDSSSSSSSRDRNMPTSYTLVALFHALDGAAAVQTFMDRIVQSRRYPPRVLEHVLTVHVYNAALQACARTCATSHFRSNNSTTFAVEHPQEEEEEDDDDDAAALVSFQVALQLFFALQRRRSTTHNNNNNRPNAKTLTLLLQQCARAGQTRVALSLLNDVVVHSVGVSPPLNQQVWGAALQACAFRGDYLSALQILQQMMMTSAGHQQSHNPEQHDEEARKINPKTASTTSSSATTTPHAITVRHMSAFLSTLAKAGRDDLAQDVLRGMCQQEPIAIHISQANKDINVTLPPVLPDLIAVNTVMDACAKAGHYSDAKLLLKRLESGDIIGPTGTSLSPDVVSYNTVLSACRDSIEAKSILQHMRASRRYRYGAVPPDVVTYTQAIKACRHSDPPDVATALQCLELAQHHDGITPNVYMYSAAIWTAERAGDAETALWLLQEMKNNNEVCRPNVVSYNGVISALAVQGRAQEAVELWDEMKASRIRPTRTTFQRLASSIRWSKKGGNGVNRTSLLEHIVVGMDRTARQTRVGGAVLEALVREYGSESRYEDALRIFDMIEGPSDSFCLRAILYACAEAQPPQWEDALSILHTSDIVEGSRGPAKVDSKALSYAMLACAKADQWQEALNLADLYGQSLSSSSSSATAVSLPAFNALIAACGRAGQPAVAIRLLNDMEAVFGVVPDARSCRKAVIACNQAEHEKRRRRKRGIALEKDEGQESLQWWECALALLRRMQEDGLHPDAQTFSSAISACEAAGQWQRALGVLQSMINSSNYDTRAESRLNLYCFNAAISACEKGGAWVEATELYYRMLDHGGVVTPNFVTLNSLLVALDNAGQKELAQSTYEEAVQNRVVSPWKTTRAEDGSLVRALDLHKFSGAMANAAIRSVMESLLGDYPFHDVCRDLVILVGKGKGSEYKPVLSSVVQNLLQREFDSDGRVDPSNEGRLIVDSESLQSFVRRKRWR